MACKCEVGPGKFEGEGALTFMAYQQMCLGNVDENVGRYDFFKAPFNFDADREVTKAAKEYGYCDECIEEASGHGKAYGLAIYESDQGFIYCETFETEKDYDKAIAIAQEESEDNDNE